MESGGVLRDVTEGWIYGDAPGFQQPFGDVAPVAVALAPGAQLGRIEIRLWREL